MLKALGFQLLELLEIEGAFKVLVSTASLHPYIVERAVGPRGAGGGGGASAVRHCGKAVQVDIRLTPG